MKLTINVDCTPLEARLLLGLPDVQPIQTTMMKQMEEKMAGAMNILDPEALARQWAPIGMQSLEQFQKLLFGAARMAASASEDFAQRAKPAVPPDKP
jgi:Family of unknown function (DUF6489)